MRIIFMGTPHFAVPSLDALLENEYQIVAIVTQPDRPVGRKKELHASPVKKWGEKHGIPVLQPKSLKAPEAIEEVLAFCPDLIITAAYGQIVPVQILQAPQFGCLNIHGSLLPKYRGGAPIQRALMNGENKTGVTLMYMAEGLDTGDMIAKVEVLIEPEDHSGTLFEKLSHLGATLLIDTLPAIMAGTASREPQDHNQASYAKNLNREDEKINWHKSSKAIHDQIRGLIPHCGAFTVLNNQNFKIWEAYFSDENVSSAEPGEITRIENDAIHVQCSEGTLQLLKVQPAGKKVMDVETFLLGNTLEPGMKFER